MALAQYNQLNRITGYMPLWQKIHLRKEINKSDKRESKKEELRKKMRGNGGREGEEKWKEGVNRERVEGGRDMNERVLL